MTSEDPLITLQREGRRILKYVGVIFALMAVVSTITSFNNRGSVPSDERVVELQRPLTDTTMRRAFLMMQKDDSSITEANLTARQKYQLNEMYSYMKRMDEDRARQTANGFSDGYAASDEGWGS